MKTFQQINAHTCTHAQTSKQTERMQQTLLTSHSRAPLVIRMSLSGAMMSSPQKLDFHWTAYISSINPYLFNELVSQEKRILSSWFPRGNFIEKKATGNKDGTRWREAATAERREQRALLASQAEGRISTASPGTLQLWRACSQTGQRGGGMTHAASSHLRCLSQDETSQNQLRSRKQSLLVCTTQSGHL